MTARYPIIGVRIPPALKQEFADIATKQNTTMSVLTRELIQTFIKQQKPTLICPYVQ